MRRHVDAGVRVLLQMVSSDYIFLCPEDTFIRVLYTVVSGRLHCIIFCVREAPRERNNILSWQKK